MKTKEGKQIIHIAIHTPTGAKIPMRLLKVGKDNIIEQHEEVPDGRSCFSFDMICNRWDMAVEDVAGLLDDYEVPMHMRPEQFEEMKRLISPEEATVLDYAVVFEEYIYGVEKKENLPHSKLKARPFVITPMH